MNAQEELNPEDRSEPLAAANAAAGQATSPDDGRDKPARPAEARGAPPVENDACEGAPKAGAPRLNLIPYLISMPEAAAETAPKADRTAGWARWVSGLAAGLALVAAITAVGLYDHARQSNILVAKTAETASLAQTVRSLKQRIAAIETTRAHDESVDSHKIAVEMKAAREASRELNGAVAQLTARIDRVDHDQTARIDKLGDREAVARIAELNARVEKLEKRPPLTTVAAQTARSDKLGDREAVARIAELNARVEKLEKRPPLATVAAQTARSDKLGDREAAARIAELNARVEKLEKRPPLATVAAIAPAAAAAPLGPKATGLVSHETTGSIGKPKPMLRSYRLVDVEGDYVLVDGRDGPRQVAPGDVLPGAGRVLRLERRDHNWVLVTSVGFIAGD